MQFFDKKKIFITGGSSGIGKALAIKLSGWGAHVYIAARGQERLDKALAEVKAAAKGSQTIGAVQMDIADRQAIKNVAKEVLESLGGLDILINNAGVARPGHVQELDDDIFDEMMTINYFGTVNVTRAFLPHFVAQKSGHICNVSSVLGMMGIFGYTAYAASKFAVTGFSECLRQELMPHGIDVSVVFPADVDTPQLHGEEEFKPAETKAISGTVKMLPPDAVASCIAEGIKANKHRIVPGFNTKFVLFWQRHWPWLVRAMTDGDVKKALRKS
jgi:3-dehydrosphinganine reductase